MGKIKDYEADEDFSQAKVIGSVGSNGRTRNFVLGAILNWMRTQIWLLDDNEFDAIRGASFPSGQNVFATKNDLPEPLLSKSYKAYITHDTGGDPSVDVLENNLGGDISWVRSAQGVLLGTSLQPLFAHLSKLVVHQAQGQIYLSQGEYAGNFFISQSSFSPTNITLTTSDASTYEQVDGCLSAFFIHIEIWT